MGKLIYKEFTINGKTEGHWVELFSESEFNSNGKEIYSKDSRGVEYWTEYDTNGNKIHYKDSDGNESWREYDTNGNEIHLKRSNGYESWKV